eukprot:jgi/Antlo1/1716/1867
MESDERLNIKKYQTEIERKLDAFKYAREWSDFVSLLSGVDATINAYECDFVPKTKMLCKRLMQCLNPALPAGVHSRALQTYALVFSKFSKDKLTRNFQIVTFGFFSSAANIKTFSYELYLEIIKNYILPLGKELKKYTVNVLIGLLPFLEAENNEFFLKAVHILEDLKREVSNKDFYFSMWQCFYADPNARQSIINFMLKCSPKDKKYYPDNEDLIVQSIYAGLSDKSIVVLRGTLDILLQTSLFSSMSNRRGTAIKIVLASLQLLLLRDVSLNKRIHALLLSLGEAQEKMYYIICEALCILIGGNESDMILFYQIISTFAEKRELLYFLVENLGAVYMLKTFLLEKEIESTNRMTPESLQSKKKEFLKHFEEFHYTIDLILFFRVLLSKFVKHIKTNDTNKEQNLSKEDAMESSAVSETNQNEEVNTDTRDDKLCKSSEKHSTVSNNYKIRMNGIARLNKSDINQNGNIHQKILMYEDLVKKLHNPNLFLSVIDYFLMKVDIVDNEAKKVHVSSLILILIKHHKLFNIVKILKIIKEHSVKLSSYEREFCDITQDLENYYMKKDDHECNIKDLCLIGANICYYIKTLIYVPNFGVLCRILEIAFKNYGFFEHASNNFWSAFYNNLLEREHSDKLRAIPLLKHVCTENMDHNMLFECLFTKVTPESVECLFKFNVIFKGKLEKTLLRKVVDIDDNDESLLKRFMQFFLILIEKYESKEFCLLPVLIYLNNKVTECSTNSQLFSEFVGFFSQIHNVAYVCRFFVHVVNTSNTDAVVVFEMQNQGLPVKPNGKALPPRLYVNYPQIEIIMGALMLLENFLKYSYHFCEHISICHTVGSSIKQDILDVLLFLAMTELKKNPLNISSECVQIKSLEVMHYMIAKGIIKSTDILSYDLTDFMKHLAAKKDQRFIANSTNIIELGINESNSIVCSFLVEYFRKSTIVQSKMVEIMLRTENKKLQFEMFKDIMNSIDKHLHIENLYIIINYILNNASQYTSENVIFTVKKSIELLYKFHTYKYKNRSVSENDVSKNIRKACAEGDILTIFTEKILTVLYRKRKVILIDCILNCQPNILLAENYPIRNKIYEAILESVLSKDKRVSPYLRKMTPLYGVMELRCLFSEVASVLSYIFITNKTKCDIEHYTYLLEIYLKLYPMNKYNEFVIKTFENMVFFLQKFVIYRITQDLDGASAIVQLYKLFITGFGMFFGSIHSQNTFQTLFYMFYQIIVYKTDTAVYFPTLVFFNELAVHSVYSRYWTREFYEVLFMPEFFNETKEVLLTKFEITKKLVKLDAERFGDVFYKLDHGFFLSREAEMQNRAQVLKRLAFLIFSGEMDQFTPFIPKILEKVNEFFGLGNTIIRHVFFIVRTMMLRMNHAKLTNLWPMLFNEIFRIFEKSIESRNVGPAYEALKVLDIMFVLNTPETMEYHTAFITKKYTNRENISVRYGHSQALIQSHYNNCSEDTECELLPDKSRIAGYYSSHLLEKHDALSYFERLSYCLSSKYEHIYLNIPDKRRPLLNIVANGMSKLQLREYLDCAPVYYLHLDIHASTIDTESITSAMLDDFWI